MWDAVEADFMRDYGIDLVEQINTMSWRRFQTLLYCLSANGAVAIRIRRENQMTEKTTATGEEAANAFFASIVSAR